MTVRPKQAWRERIPWGILGMMLLVFLIEKQISRRSLQFLDSDDWAYRQNRREATREATRAEILCFGDSLVKYGVLPSAVETRTGCKTYNLALAGGQASASEALLRIAIKSGAKPRAIVVDFFPPILKVPPKSQGTRWSSLLSISETLRLAWSAGDFEWFGKVMMADGLPSLRGRGPIRESIQAALAGKSGVWPWANTMALRNWSRNAGAQLMPVRSSVAKISSAEADHWAGDFFGKFTCANVNARAINGFLALAASRNIPVYWVIPPEAPLVRGRLDASGHTAAHRAFIEGFQARFANVVVLDGSSSLEDPTGYFDPQHLGPEGAHGFSLALGDALRKDLANRVQEPSRWVTMAACRPHRLPDGVEDLDMSALALEAKFSGTPTVRK